MLAEITEPDGILGTNIPKPSSFVFDLCLWGSQITGMTESDIQGGVLIAVKTDLELANVEKSKEVKMISRTLKLTKTRKMFLCSCYRPPNKPVYLARVKEDLFFGY